MSLKSDPNNSQFLRNIHFLWDAIDLKQSVEGALKVQEKSLTAALNEVHFVVNLYSFSLPLVPQEKILFSKVTHLFHLTSKATPNLPLLLLFNSLS